MLLFPLHHGSIFVAVDRPFSEYPPSDRTLRLASVAHPLLTFRIRLAFRDLPLELETASNARLPYLRRVMHVWITNYPPPSSMLHTCGVYRGIQKQIRTSDLEVSAATAALPYNTL